MRGPEGFTHSINFENGEKPILPKRKVPAIINGVLAFVAIGSRLIICPGDEIAFVIASAVAGGVHTTETLKDATLPEPIEIISEEKDENKDKKK